MAGRVNVEALYQERFKPPCLGQSQAHRQGYRAGLEYMARPKHKRPLVPPFPNPYPENSLKADLWVCGFLEAVRDVKDGEPRTRRWVDRQYAKYPDR